MPATCRSSTTITDLALASAVVARAGPLAADRPSASSQLPQTALQRPGIVDSSAIGADREPGDAPVHPDHRTLNGRRVLPVDSLVATRPIRGSTTAPSWTRIAPVRRNRSGQRPRFFHLGRPIRRPDLRPRQALA